MIEILAITNLISMIVVMIVTMIMWRSHDKSALLMYIILILGAIGGYSSNLYIQNVDIREKILDVKQHIIELEKLTREKDK